MKRTVEPKEKLSGLLQKTADFSKKTAEKTVDFGKKAAEKTVDISKKVADNVQENAKALSEKSKDEAYLRKLKKYNPLFPDQYFSPEFNRPNMIVIVDDAVRKGIDVCEGAIGWLSNSNGMEVLNLYDEAVELSGIRFVPSADCDAIYYIDSFDHNRYIRIDSIFDLAHKEKIAELEHIAFSLGAKKCTIRLREVHSESDVQQKKYAFGVSGKKNGVSVSSAEEGEKSSAIANQTEKRGENVTVFSGCATPTRPHLKWFANDDSVASLVEMRCANANGIKSKQLKLSGSSISTMSQKTACSIDSALNKINAKASAKMEQHVKKETHTELLFDIEF